jgi:aryl-alcohol dehydrogenase-like predicted oxidoreductase
MPEALTVANQTVAGERVSLIEAASTLGITVVSSASIFQGRLAQGLPESLNSALGSLPTDAQTAIQFARSTPGLTTALIGMSRKDHVEENLELARVAPVEQEQFLQLFSTS